LGDGEQWRRPTGRRHHHAPVAPIRIVSDGVAAVAAQAFAVFSSRTMAVSGAWGTIAWASLAMARPTKAAGSPVKIVSDGVVAIAAGVYHSLFIKRDGSLWGMGNNEIGQLGEAARTNWLKPAQILAKDVVAILCGWHDQQHVCQKGRQPLGHGCEQRRVCRWLMSKRLKPETGDHNRAAHRDKATGFPAARPLVARSRSPPNRGAHGQANATSPSDGAGWPATRRHSSANLSPLPGTSRHSFPVVVLRWRHGTPPPPGRESGQ